MPGSNSEQLQKENYDTTQKRTVVKGEFVAQPHSRARATSTSRVSEVNDRGSGRTDSLVTQENVLHNTGGIRNGSTPLDKRPGALDPDASSTKPRIEIVERQALAFSSRRTSAAQEEARRLAEAATGFLFGDRASQAIADAAAQGIRVVFRDRFIIGAYDGFILTNVQEQDADKVVVTETFGDPHIFASGRFIRKYTFTGFVRTTGVNYLSREDSLRVPQNVQFRVFYDKYLRVTEQVKAGRFTRIIVDGEIYEGYVTTMNRGRDSMNEHFQSITFTMLGVRQENARHEGAAERLLRRFKSEGRSAPQYPARVAEAELTDALGELELYLTEAGALDSKRDILTTDPVVVQRERTTINTGVRLGAIGNPQVLRVTSDVPGVDLQYTYKTASESGRTGEGQPVHRSLATVNREGVAGRPIDMVITNYGLFYRWALDNAVRITSRQGQILPSGEPIPDGAVTTAVPFNIIADGGSSVELIYQVTLLNAAQFEVSEVTLEALNNSQQFDLSSDLSDVAALQFSDLTMYTEGGNVGIVGASNELPLRLRVELSDTGLERLGTELLNAATATIDNVVVIPHVGRGQVRSADRNRITASLAAEPTVTKITGAGAVQLDFILKLQAYEGADLTDPDQNPYDLANVASFGFDLKVKVPGLVQKFPEGITATGYRILFGGRLKSSDDVDLTGLQFLGWTSQERRVDRTYQLGYYTFKLSTTNGLPLRDELLGQLREQGRLNIDFQNSGMVPAKLNGSAFKIFRTSSKNIGTIFTVGGDREGDSFKFSGGGYVFRVWVDANSEVEFDDIASLRTRLDPTYTNGVNANNASLRFKSDIGLTPRSTRMRGR